MTTVRRWVAKPLYWPMDAIYVIAGVDALHAYIRLVRPVLQRLTLGVSGS
jgi:hypothetical protein